jgi:hypothetical protein
MRSFLIAAAVLVTLLFLIPRDAVTSPVYSRRTNKECNYCHPPGTYNLNGAGKYYQEHKSLNGYQPKDAPKKPDTTGTTKNSGH